MVRGRRGQSEEDNTNNYDNYLKLPVVDFQECVCLGLRDNSATALRRPPQLEPACLGKNPNKRATNEIKSLEVNQ
jgi:hypothetical protein